MDELRMVRREDGAIILANELGEEYRLAIDDVVASEIRQLSKRPAGPSSVRPREIQALLRAGKSRAEVADELGQEVGVGEPGEVLYRSPQLAVGYWDNPEATAEAFRDGWFHSGDLVTRDAEGYLTVVDRIKDVINTGGILVASREVEDAVYTHPAVAEVAVIGTPHEKWIEAVTAVVVLRDDAEDVTAEQIIAHVRERLAPFKVPKEVRFVDVLPRNQSGKLLKRELREDG